MSNYKVQIKVNDSSSTTGTRNENLNYKNMTGAGYLAVDGKNNIFLTASATGEELSLEKDEEGNWAVPDGYNPNLLEIDSATGKAAVLDWDIPKNLSGNNLISIDSSGKVTIPGSNETYNPVNGNEYLKKEETLQNAIVAGNLLLIDTNNVSLGKIIPDSLSADTSLTYVLNTDDDAAAESEHEYEMARVTRQEKAIEMEIKQLDTEHEALLKELESIKEVISNNVDRTFKLFSNG